MAAPVYLDLSRSVAGWIFYGLGAFGLIGLLFEVWTEMRSPRLPGARRGYRPWLAIIFGAIVLVGCAWLFWPASPRAVPGLPVPKPKLFSTLRKTILVCDKPKTDPELSTKEREIELNKYADIMQGTFGIAVSHTAIPNGIRLQFLMPPHGGDATTEVTQQAWEIRRLNDQLYINITNEVAGGMAFLFGIFPVDPDDDITKATVAQVEKFIGAQSGKCKLL